MNFIDIANTILGILERNMKLYQLVRDMYQSFSCNNYRTQHRF